MRKNRCNRPVPTTRPLIGCSPHCPHHRVLHWRTVCGEWTGTMKRWRLSPEQTHEPASVGRISRRRHAPRELHVYALRPFRDESRDSVDEWYGLRPIAPFAAGQGPPYANRSIAVRTSGSNPPYEFDLNFRVFCLAMSRNSSILRL